MPVYTYECRAHPESQVDFNMRGEVFSQNEDIAYIQIKDLINTRVEEQFYGQGIENLDSLSWIFSEGSDVSFSEEDFEMIRERGDVARGEVIVFDRDEY